MGRKSESSLRSTDRNTVHRLKKRERRKVSCSDFIFVEDFLCFVSKSKSHHKRWEREVKGHSHLEKSQDGNHFSRAFVGGCCIVNQPYVFLGCNNNIPDTNFQRSDNVDVCWQRPVWGILCLLPMVLLFTIWRYVPLEILLSSSSSSLCSCLSSIKMTTEQCSSQAISQDWVSSSKTPSQMWRWVSVHSTWSQSDEETWKIQGQEGHPGVNCLSSLLWQTTQRSLKLEWRLSKDMFQKMLITSWQRCTVWETGLLHNSSMTTMVCALHPVGMWESALSVHNETLQRRLHYVTSCAVFTTTTQWACCVLGDDNNNSNKLAEGTVLTPKGTGRRKSKRGQGSSTGLSPKQEMSAWVSRKNCLENKQAVKIDKMACSCECTRCLCPHHMCAYVSVQKKIIHWCSWAQCIV